MITQWFTPDSPEILAILAVLSRQHPCDNEAKTYRRSRMFEAQRLEKLPVQSDRRADGGSRQVSVSRKGVSIARRLKGVSMLIRVPVSAYRGVTLDIKSSENGAAAYRLALAHSDPELDVLLVETQDCVAAAAEWKYWSSFLDLPRLAVKSSEFAPLDAMIGGLRAKESLARRGASAVVRRRPRFLARRKSGDKRRMCAVFSGEREIVCYE
jgi:hypothetical protein